MSRLRLRLRIRILGPTVINAHTVSNIIKIVTVSLALVWSLPGCVESMRRGRKSLMETQLATLLSLWGSVS